MKKIINALGWKFDEKEEMYKVYTPKPNHYLYFSRRLVRFFDSIPLSTIPLCLDQASFLKIAHEYNSRVKEVPDNHFTYVVIPYLSKRMELGR